jgi:hypothetical protein
MLWLGLLSGTSAGAASYRGNFTLPAAASTSAGVFSADGTLVRTLWSGQRLEAGTHAITWDGLDEFGVAFKGTPTVRVLAHNLKWTWEGVIGNTSRDRTGPAKHRSFEAAWGMAFAPDGRGFLAVGYNEQQYPMFRFHQNDYQARWPVGHDDYQRSFSLVTVDTNRVFFANTGSGFNAVNFVIAFNASGTNYSEHLFAAGVAESPGVPGQYWQRVLDRGNSRITGLAVQRSGSHLFVAHAEENQIRMFDKTTGVALGTLDVEAPTALATAPNGDLWAAARENGVPIVRRWTLVGTTWTPVITLTTLEAPLAIAVSPDGATVAVADGGSRQQVRAFSPGGAALWTKGLAGGYDVHGAEVTTDKFLFRDRTYWRERSYLAFSPDGRLWVGDVGNERTLIYDANNNYSDQILYLPHSYTVAVDANDPRRVFNYWQEFEVDYTKPLEQGWKLVRNWSAGLARHRFSGFAEGLANVVTLTHGAVKRTFALVPDFTTYGPDKFRLMELATNGVLRETGQRYPETRSIYADGTLRSYETTPTEQKILSQTLTGFDPTGNPLWSTPALLATAPAGLRDPHYRGAFSSPSGPRFPSTASGLVVFFDTEKRPVDARGWHLGGVAAGGNAWKFRASPSGRFRKNCDADMTNFPAVHRPCWYQEGDVVAADGSYDVVDSKTQYGGNRVMAAGTHIVYGYHGEFWNNGQANQWLHFHESGLFLTQFGKANYPVPNRDAALAETAGNAFTPALVSVNGTLYLWHNDESAHAGVHRWRLDGAATLQPINVPLTVAPEGPRLSGGIDASGRFAISVPQGSGGTLVLERSYDLRNWQAVATNGSGNFAVEPAIPNDTNRSIFFRARLLQ